MDKPKPHRIPCKHPFSNGTEFEMFLENCYGCSRYRNGKCRIVYACEKAMFDIKYFPYDDKAIYKYIELMYNNEKRCFLSEFPVLLL